MMDLADPTPTPPGARPRATGDSRLINGGSVGAEWRRVFTCAALRRGTGNSTLLCCAPFGL
jgi:hypothetical protein